MHKYSVRKDERDIRDRFYRSPFTAQTMQLPKSVDLRSYCSAVVDQGTLGSCTANAIVSGLREYIELQTLTGEKDFVELSRLFLYWHERFVEGTVDEDEGATIRTGMKVLHKIGVCPESLHPYEIDKFKEKPSEKADQEASSYRIDAYRRIVGLNGLKMALADGKPVVIGFHVYESFESEEVARTGKIPVPNVCREELLGGHAVLAVGYRDGWLGKGEVIIRNSWGSEWGDDGYCYFPYKMFDKNIVFDMWTY